uniref:IG domain-containing protein n=1 Tax=Angiostrongylus cantonensis TaxID=6313 RepID=A0A0K0D6I1_ANGCA
MTSYLIILACMSKSSIEDSDASVLDRRPLFIVPLTDQRVREGDNVLLLPQISSATAFTVIWRGPAVQAGRAQISSDNDSTCLTIFGVSALDDGAYSVVAENEYGITSSLAVISVITRPGRLKCCKRTLYSNYCRPMLLL